MILVAHLVAASHHHIAWLQRSFIQVVGHNVGDAVELTLLAHVEMAHDDQRDIVLAHQVHEGILLI